VLVRLLQFAGAEQPQTGELVAWEMRTLGQPMLCRSDAYVLQALHARWLRHLYELWVVRRNSRPETTLMDFTPVLREAFEHMVNAMQRLPLDVSLSLPEMADAFARQLSGPQMVMVEEVVEAEPEAEVEGVAVEDAEAEADRALDAIAGEYSVEEHRMLAMGFDIVTTRRALEWARGDVQAAVSFILER